MIIKILRQISDTDRIGRSVSDRRAQRAIPSYVILSEVQPSSMAGFSDRDEIAA